jgi:hypothetical protein
MIYNWFHKFLNPHCPHCKEEQEYARTCFSCETLRTQIEISRIENKRLLDRILEKPTVETPSLQPMEPTRPLNIPWNVRRQMLESEDREKARLMAQAPKPISTEELEKELDVATEKREEAR